MTFIRTFHNKTLSALLSASLLSLSVTGLAVAGLDFSKIGIPQPNGQHTSGYSNRATATFLYSVQQGDTSYFNNLPRHSTSIVLGAYMTTFSQFREPNSKPDPFLGEIKYAAGWKLYAVSFLQAYEDSFWNKPDKDLHKEQSRKLVNVGQYMQKVLRESWGPSSNTSRNDFGVLHSQLKDSPVTEKAFIKKMYAFIEPEYSEAQAWVASGSKVPETATSPQTPPSAVPASETVSGTKPDTAVVPPPGASANTKSPKEPSVLKQNMQKHFDDFLDKGINKVFGMW